MKHVLHIFGVNYPEGVLFYLLFLVVIVPASRGTEYHIRSFRNERSLAILTHPEWLRFIRQHEGEHHFYVQQQRMKIPDQHRFVSQLYVIGRRIAVKSLHALSVKHQAFFIKAVPVLIIQERGHKSK